MVRRENKIMTIQFLAKMLRADLTVVVRMPLLKNSYMVCEKNTAEEMANGTDRFYQSEITDFFFRKDEIVITVDECK